MLSNEHQSANGSGSSVAAFFAGSTVAVTGAAGSVGAELVRQLLKLDVVGVRALDSDENGLFQLDTKYGRDPRLLARRCDVSNVERTRSMFHGVDYVFHAAALKHVPICEHAPMSAVDVNVAGTLNVVEAALDAGVRRLIFTSSDKAVNPTNVMGASKLMGERIACSLNGRNGRTLISCTRFGNVAGTRGSVIPHFVNQVLAKEPITLTSPEMTRFFMTLDEAVKLIVESMVYSRGGETFVTKMATFRIADLASAIVRLMAPSVGLSPTSYPIKIVGPRIGEKLYEELTTDEEQGRTFEFDKFLIIQPVALRHQLDDEIEYEFIGRANRSTKPYNSRFEPHISVADIAAYLTKHELLPLPRPRNDDVQYRAA